MSNSLTAGHLLLPCFVEAMFYLFERCFALFGTLTPLNILQPIAKFGEGERRNLGPDPRDGLAGGIALTKMVELNNELSNQLISTLQDWSDILKDVPDACEYLSKSDLDEFF